MALDPTLMAEIDKQVAQLLSALADLQAALETRVEALEMATVAPVHPVVVTHDYAGGKRLIYDLRDEGQS